MNIYNAIQYRTRVAKSIISESFFPRYNICFGLKCFQLQSLCSKYLFGHKTTNTTE